MYSKNYRIPGIFNEIIEQAIQNGKTIAAELQNESNSNVPVNIFEDSKAFYLHFIAPGILKEEIKIQAEQNILIVSYNRKKEENQTEFKAIRSEFSLKSFKRSFTLNEKIDPAAISAKYQEGILEVKLPKKENTQAEKLEIKVS